MIMMATTTTMMVMMINVNSDYDAINGGCMIYSSLSFHLSTPTNYYFIIIFIIFIIL